jgi:hypothetical protein
MNKKLNDSRVLALLLVMIMFLTVQCSSFVKTTYSALGTAGVLYDTGMKTMAELYKQGKISEEEKEATISVGEDYYRVYLSAVAALEIYQGMSKGDREGQKMHIMELMDQLTEIGDNLTSIIQKYTGPGDESFNRLLERDLLVFRGLD